MEQQVALSSPSSSEHITPTVVINYRRRPVFTQADTTRPGEDAFYSFEDHYLSEQIPGGAPLVFLLIDFTNSTPLRGPFLPWSLVAACRLLILVSFLCPETRNGVTVRRCGAAFPSSVHRASACSVRARFPTDSLSVRIPPPPFFPRLLRGAFKAQGCACESWNAKITSAHCVALQPRTRYLQKERSHYPSVCHDDSNFPGQLKVGLVVRRRHT